MPTVPAEELRRLAEAVLGAVGTPGDHARIVADHLVRSNLVGHDSHGVLRLPSYVDQVRSGQVQPAAKPIVHVREGATAQVDGRWGWGQVTARLATRTAIDLAREMGAAVITIRHCNHIGRLGEYVAQIADAGLIGHALCNAEPAVAPPGGRERLLGTNAVAWAVPRSGPDGPLIVDFATAGIAEGKLRVARDRGERVPAGLLVDVRGAPSQEPADFYAGGALLPFGAHKGYGMSLINEFLGGALSGASPSALPEYRGGNGTLLLAVNIARFIPLAVFTQQVDRLCQQIRGSSSRDDAGAITVPGDPESSTRRARTVEGIPIPEATWAGLDALAASLGIGRATRGRRSAGSNA